MVVPAQQGSEQHPPWCPSLRALGSRSRLARCGDGGAARPRCVRSWAVGRLGAVLASALAHQKHSVKVQRGQRGLRRRRAARRASAPAQTSPPSKPVVHMLSPSDGWAGGGRQGAAEGKPSISYLPDAAETEHGPQEAGLRLTKPGVSPPGILKVGSFSAMEP